MQSGSSPRLKWIRVAIVLLAVLLAVGVTAIGAQHLYWRFSDKVRDTAVLPDNIIGSRPASPQAAGGESVGITLLRAEGATAAPRTMSLTSGVEPENGFTSSDFTSLALYRGQPFENVPFDVTNMLPGDTYTNRFCIRIYHKGSIIVYFWPKIISETKSLGDVLNLKVTRLDNNQVLCDTTFRQQDGRYKAEIFQSDTQEEVESIAYYEVVVSMDTSVGNEYQAASLNADFYWSTELVSDDEPDQPDPDDPPYYYVPGTPPVTPPENPGELVDPPQTGDAAKPVLWAALAVSSLGLLLFLILRRRKEDDSDE